MDQDGGLSAPVIEILIRPNESPGSLGLLVFKWLFWLCLLRMDVVRNLSLYYFWW